MRTVVGRYEWKSIHDPRSLFKEICNTQVSVNGRMSATQYQMDNSKTCNRKRRMNKKKKKERKSETV